MVGAPGRVLVGDMAPIGTMLGSPGVDRDRPLVQLGIKQLHVCHLYFRGEFDQAITPGKCIEITLKTLVWDAQVPNLYDEQFIHTLQHVIKAL